VKRIILLLLLFSFFQTLAQKVYVLHEPDIPQSAYASRKISEALKEKGYTVLSDAKSYDFLISLEVNSMHLKPEAFSIFPEGKFVNITGGDYRGLIYGSLALVENLQTGIALKELKRLEEKPDQEFRAIKYNLPWETYRPTSALDQHMETARDLRYWESFLDMMVSNRFNVISFWNMHPYTFMIKPKNFPEASPWSAKEMADWQSFYRQLFRMAKERGLDTYIVHWSIFVSKSFADAHGVANKNYYPHYYVPGDTTELVKRYTRECVKQVLEEYPDLDGIGISHGEGMAGMTPLQRQEWMDEVIISAMKEVRRPVKLIHRVPFSSGLGSEGGTSKNVEVVTREAMEKLGDTFEGPIWVEMKFNWSHGHSSPKLIKVHGGQLGDTYFDPLPTNYKVTWQVRNEDFFALRWGVPTFIRQHIALNGKAAYTGGYFIGSECYIPAKDYFTTLEGPLNWKYAFERQWLFYKLWGRLLYNPETSDDVFNNEFTNRYGTEKGRNLLNALSLASSTALELATFYDARWDFTLYAEGMMALQGDSVKYISVDNLINQSTLDPEYISIKEYVRTRFDGGSFGAGKTTPLFLADKLERDNRMALELIRNIKEDRGNPAFIYELADIKAWAYLGLHLAEKIRGGVALHTFRQSGTDSEKKTAINHLEKALAYWDDLVKITRPLYKDMHLTHLNHNYFTANDDNLFHWEKLRDDVARDIKIAKSATKKK
jgi:hypothetical protein